MSAADYDIAIVGGGMVGASLACAVAGLGWRVAVIEAHCIDAADQPSFDDRGIALAEGSRRILQSMGVWPALKAHAEPIRRIHVSDRGHFGATRLQASEEGVTALGYVVESRVMGQVLHDLLQELENVDYLCPWRLQDLDCHDQGHQLTLENDETRRRLNARLVVAADGSRSRVRQLLGIPAGGRDYGQTAIITNAVTARPHQGTAYERFTDTGPLAFLPLTRQRSSVVWTVRTEQAEALMTLPDAAFTARLQARFGYRLGRIVRIGRRETYPLRLLQAERLTAPRAVLIGNAAHSLHPVAGQGYNLCLRDVALLAEQLQAVRERDPGDPQMLAAYAASRQADYRDVIRMTDGLVELFSNDAPLLGHARAAALVLLDLLPPGRHWLARQSMGLRARPASRLGMGLPLQQTQEPALPDAE